MVAGKGSDPQLQLQTELEGTKLKNVTYLSHQPFEKVEELFDEASAFVNTSIPDCEGFPNTYLQAWSRGIPVISFFDPDRLISMNSLGIVVESLPQLENALRLLLTSQRSSVYDSQTIQDFFIQKFSVANRISRFIQILKM
jgi:glycosyltransferase involved in cell wall biosynthesis